MDFDANVEFLRLAFYQIILTAGPLLGVALAVGLIIGIIQARVNSTRLEKKMLLPIGNHTFACSKNMHFF